MAVADIIVGYAERHPRAYAALSRMMLRRRHGRSAGDIQRFVARVALQRTGAVDIGQL